MQRKIRSQKSNLILGSDKSTRRRRLFRISEVVKEVDVRLESCLNVESIVRDIRIRGST